MSETMEGTGLLSVIKQELGVQPSKAEAEIGKAFQLGLAVTGVVVDKTWAGLTSRDEQTGAAEGPLAYLYDATRGKVLRAVASFMRGGRV